MKKLQSEVKEKEKLLKMKHMEDLCHASELKSPHAIQFQLAKMYNVFFYVIKYIQL